MTFTELLKIVCDDYDFQHPEYGDSSGGNIIRHFLETKNRLSYEIGDIFDIEIPEIEPLTEGELDDILNHPSANRRIVEETAENILVKEFGIEK